MCHYISLFKLDRIHEQIVFLALENPSIFLFPPYSYSIFLIRVMGYILEMSRSQHPLLAGDGAVCYTASTKSTKGALLMAEVVSLHATTVQQAPGVGSAAVLSAQNVSGNYCCFSRVHLSLIWGFVAM